MNTALWIVQGILGIMMFLLGVMKSLLPVEKLNKLSWTRRNSSSFIRFVGISELLIGLGLILPELTGILPILTPIAGASLCLIMILAIAEHIRFKETHDISKNIIILLLGIFVVIGRFNLLYDAPIFSRLQLDNSVVSVDPEVKFHLADDVYCRKNVGDFGGERARS